ncbi:MAG: phosphotransferase [Actinomycetota bacterium]
MTEEIPLVGGRANADRVVRIGEEVARPRHPQAPFVEDFLRHLRAVGCELGPQPLGTDDRGRQRLSFIPGEAPTSPYPDWAFDEALLADLASRQRELHAAAATYRAPDGAVWAVSGGDYFPEGTAGSLFCHNDLCMSNVIVDVDRRRVVGFVDFDYVAPVDPLFDIAVLARHWVPFGQHGGAGDRDLDRVRRFGLIAEAHELASSDRRRVIELGIAFLDRARTNVRALADAGNVGFQRLIADGYEDANRRTVAWITDHLGDLSGD